ncbi:uncharacterized protein N0V89_000952 [Didymosphaeria variabile]|uniref:Uncharacterized protein n=1 Tax=Didymosphaeria variabile TaxID=1932322 RepID=A0A9W8XXI9_9PLEO|nr:uncharacterized protein N0V89_000952 [Didymosphaeria variabile]KAJ4360390.1 hypothetical protein N0V89_000952 [Didymosphaeria variabile]
MFDAVQLRTLWLRPLPTSVCVAASVRFAVKLALWFAEAQNKFTWLREDYRSQAPETLSGVYARRVFWWLNGLMKRGYKATFRPMDLMAIKRSLGRSLLEALQSGKDKGGLLSACLRAFKLDVAYLVVPRTIMLTLSYTLPFLFQAIIGHLDMPFDNRNPSNGYLLITATGLLYLSLAISKTYYQHKTYQLVTKIRGALALLNRLPVVDGYHVKKPDERIVYCAQKPWLPSGTIRDAIIGGSQPDGKWYIKVLMLAHFMKTSKL